MNIATMDDCIAYLKRHGKEIGAKALAGDPLAKGVVSTYSIFTHGYHENEVGILCGAIENYDDNQEPGDCDFSGHQWRSIQLNGKACSVCLACGVIQEEP